MNEHYIVDGNKYTAEDGYVFKKKDNGYICTGFYAVGNLSIDNFDCIEKPPEPIYEELEENPEEVNDNE